MFSLAAALAALLADEAPITPPNIAAPRPITAPIAMSLRFYFYYSFLYL